LVREISSGLLWCIQAREAVPEWWPAAIAQRRGGQNASSSSGCTLAAAARAVGATKTLGAFLCNFNSTFMHSSEPVFAIINQEEWNKTNDMWMLFSIIFSCISQLLS
jgi:hypothetical protein